MKKLKKICLFSCSILFSFSVVATEYYTWIDENGIPNFSEKVPVGYEGTKVTKNSNLGYRPSSPEEQNSEDTPGKKNTGEEKSTEAKNAEIDAQAVEETKKVEQEIAEIKRSNCEIGKRNLAQLQAYARVRMKGEDGKERVMGEEEKQAKINEARQIIQENCMG